SRVFTVVPVCVLQIWIGCSVNAIALWREAAIAVLFLAAISFSDMWKGDRVSIFESDRVW
ncbi:MAG: hypothetical protein LH647_23650, partial [Leptolyngbyaceae cyanobacterium CAN_BIN12]|nr:hypothetical protein [Leptolyngbyaceae cyanobacterium CAN_BIN12]